MNINNQGDTLIKKEIKKIILSALAQTTCKTYILSWSILKLLRGMEDQSQSSDVLVSMQGELCHCKALLGTSDTFQEPALPVTGFIPVALRSDLCTLGAVHPRAFWGIAITHIAPSLAMLCRV